MCVPEHAQKIEIRIITCSKVAAKQLFDDELVVADWMLRKSRESTEEPFLLNPLNIITPHTHGIASLNC